MLEVREVPGRGRGVFAARDIKGGEVVLREQPLLLYPQQGTAAAFCSHCLRAFNSLDDSAATVVPCASCGCVGFCGPACAAAAAADPGSHCAAVCALLRACNGTGLSDEQHTALQFLARVCSLRIAAASGDAAAGARLAALASLAAPPQLPPGTEAAPAATAGPDMVTRELHGRLSHAVAAAGAPPEAALALGEAAELLRRDAANGYGIMAPSAFDGERRIRGTALCVRASLLNHECLPNVARFDRFDAAAAAPGANAALEFRALHDIPAGEELTQSYFPLPWPLAERRQRCQEDYGFTCACPRCLEEAVWSEGEGEWEMEEDPGMTEAEGGHGPHHGAASSHSGHDHSGHDCASHDHGAGEQPEGEAPGVDAAYISLFMLKFVCPAEGCGGTLAPLAPGGGAAAVYECSMCGRQRTEAEFMAELEAGQ